MNLLLQRRIEQINDISQHLSLIDIRRLHHNINKPVFDEELEIANRVAILNKCVILRKRTKVNQL